MSASSETNNSPCNWLLVEWKTGGQNVVFIRSVVSPLNKELKEGDLMMVNRRGKAEAATLVARARDRDTLDKMLKASEEAGSSSMHVEKAEDFSSSASSWVPSDDDDAQSGDSAKVKKKKVTFERCKRQYPNRSTKKIITPARRATPVIPKRMQQSKMNRKRAHNSPDARKTSINKSLPDSTIRRNSLQKGNGNKKMTIDVRELMFIKNSFIMLFNLLELLKQTEGMSTSNQSSEEHVPKPLKAEDRSHTPYNQSVEEDEQQSGNEEFNRSDDNVLITNKHVAVQTAKQKGTENGEWVPIGSGKTLIHRDQFKKVKWTSYTIATRTLLLAVFKRRILATHSLTGKRSPAFKDKPAKMCLDPKIISDVIMEIMDRFNVRENLVRSIITTKCADECKMWRTRMNKKKAKNNENMPTCRATSSNTEQKTTQSN